MEIQTTNKINPHAMEGILLKAEIYKNTLERFITTDIEKKLRELTTPTLNYCNENVRDPRLVCFMAQAIIDFIMDQILNPTLASFRMDLHYRVAEEKQTEHPCNSSL